MWRKLLGGSGMRSRNGRGARSRRSHGFARTRFGRALRYGEALETRHLLATVALVTETTNARAFVPSSSQDIVQLGLDWTGSDALFDDSAWSPTVGPNGVGYDGTATKYDAFIGLDVETVMRSISATALVRIPFIATNVESLSELKLNVRFDDGFIAWINGVEIVRQNAPSGYPLTTTGSGSRATASPVDQVSQTLVTFDASSHLNALVNGSNVLAIRGFNAIEVQNDFLIQATLSGATADPPLEAVDDAVTFPSTQPFAVINVLANDFGGTVGLNPTSVQIVDQPANGTVAVNPTTGQISYTAAPGFSGRDRFTYRVRDNSSEPTPGGDVLQTTVVSTTALHQRLVPTAADAALGTMWTNPTFVPTAWTTAAGGIGYDNDPTFLPYIGDNIGALASGINATAYMRVPFTLTDPTLVQQLRLRMRYDDGFVAYINGVEVARANAPAVLAWNSQATATHDDALAIDQVEFSIPLTGLTLRTGLGANILAIHALNSPATSSDFLAQPELIADSGTKGVWSNEATVTVNVQGPGPVTADDVAVTPIHRPVTVAVLENDMPGTSGAPLRPESVVVSRQPTNGTTLVDPTTGAIEYAPNAGFLGHDTFEYTVRDNFPRTDVQQDVVFIAANSSWKYLDTGADLGTAWSERTFDDVAWSSGNAPLGYPGGTTVVGYGGDANNKFITTYFRKSFNVDDASKILELTLNLTYDDGAVVYINGSEVGRVNMPAGAVTYQTLASAAGNATVELVLTGGQLAALRSGDNVIAVEIHQNARTSADIVFNLRVQGTVAPPTGNLSLPATVTVTVVPSDDPPTAVDDELSVKYGRSTVIPVLANDLLGGSLFDPASVEIVAPPVHGAVEVQSDGSVVYLPDALYLGEDSFVYTVRDTAGRLSNAGPVSILVTNDAPLAVADAYSVEEDDVLILLAANGLLANDVDDGLTPVVLEAIEMPAQGTLVLAADGAFQYTPHADFAGVDTFRYRVTDELGATAEASVTVHVIATPDAPVAVDDVYATTFNTPLLLGMALPTPTTFVAAGAIWRYVDSGADLGFAWREGVFDDAAWKTGGAPLGYGNGTETTLVEFGGDPVDRHITTYFRHAFDVADATRVGALTLELMRDDGAAVFLNGVEVARNNLPAEATYTTLATQAAVGDDETTYFPFEVPVGSLVDGVNVLAVEVHQSHPASGDLAFDFRLVGMVTGPISDSVLVNDTDADGDVLGALLVAGPAHGTLSFSAEGSFVYTPDAGFVGVDTFMYRATDGERQSNVATVTIQVNASSNVAADLNEDGSVNEADLAIVATHFGTASGAEKATGDANGDGRVDLQDVLTVQRAFGEVEASAPAAVVASRRIELQAQVVGDRPVIARAESMRAARRSLTPNVRTGDTQVVDAAISNDDLLRGSVKSQGLRSARILRRG